MLHVNLGGDGQAKQGGMMRIKNSVGIWAFQEMPTRFLGAGYHPEYKDVDMIARGTSRHGSLSCHRKRIGHWLDWLCE